MTMKQLGEKFNLAESTISGYENDSRKPDIELVNKFADYFETNADYLMGRTDDRSPSSTTSKTAVSVEPGVYIAYLGGPPEEMDEVEAQHIKKELEEFRRFREERRKRMEQQKET